MDSMRHNSGFSEEAYEHRLGVNIQHLPQKVNLNGAQLLNMDVLLVRPGRDFTSMDKVAIQSRHVDIFELFRC
jgi:hypothetical protein